MAELRREGRTYKQIGDELGCSMSSVWLLLRGMRQKGLAYSLPEEELRVPHWQTRGAKLTPDQVRTIRRLRRTGHTYAQISELVGISITTAFNVVKHKYWRFLPPEEESND